MPSATGVHSSSDTMTDLVPHFSHMTASGEYVRQSVKAKEEAEALSAVHRMDPSHAQETAAILAENSPNHPGHAYMWLETLPDGVTQIHTLNGDRWALSEKCAWCLDVQPLSDLVTGGCAEHALCPACIVRAFEIALDDVNLPTPHCCGSSLWTEYVREEILDWTLGEGFAEWLAEADNPNRVYCSTEGCRKLVYGRWDRGSFCPDARCSHCEKLTCVLCKEPAHADEPCAESEEGTGAEALAVREGWVMCFRCRIWVERTEGCRHMICYCGAQFCYDCKEPTRCCKCDFTSGTDEDRDPEAERRLHKQLIMSERRQLRFDEQWREQAEREGRTGRGSGDTDDGQDRNSLSQSAPAGAEGN